MRFARRRRQTINEDLYKRPAYVLDKDKQRSSKRNAKKLLLRSAFNCVWSGSRFFSPRLRRFAEQIAQEIFSALQCGFVKGG